MIEKKEHIHSWKALPRNGKEEIGSEKQGSCATVLDMRKEKTIEEFAPKIRYLAQRLAFRLPPQIDVDDLVSTGMMGLLDAIEKFDPARGVQFKTYAEFRIRGAMVDEIRAMDWVPRSVRKKAALLQKTYADFEKRLGRPASEEEMAEAFHMEREEFRRFLVEVSPLAVISVEELGMKQDGEKMSVTDGLVEPDGKTPLSLMEEGEVKKCLWEAIRLLPEKEKLVISLYYYDELTMKEIGVVLGITESRVSQLHAQAIFRLKGKLTELIKG